MSESREPFDRELGSDVVTALMSGRHGKLHGKEITFLCPAHEDHKPSAGYNVDKQTWNCQACGEHGGLLDLARRLGIDTTHQRRPERKQAREIVATYDYTDLDGSLLYQSVRYEPKGFSQRRPDGKGGWVWDLNGTVPVPYRLPNVAYAGEDEPVYIVEGEKDADNLIAAGLVATTNHGGAKKWRDVHSKHLKGRAVVLLPDNDTPGREHMALVGRSLLEVGVKGMKYVELPGLDAKGDVSDWLAMGHTVSELAAIVARADEWTPPPDPLDMLADSPAKPGMERSGLGYAFRYPTENVNLLVDHIHRSGDGMNAEMLITGEIPACPRHLHWAKVNLASTSSRSGIVKHLTKRTEGAAIDWTTIIEDVCYQVAMEERKGEPFVQLGDLPMDSRGRWLIENIAPLGQPTTIFGPGSSGKSRLVAALAIGVESGQEIVPGCRPCVQGRTLYLDWETDGEEIQQRVREICKGAEIDEVYPLYRRCTGTLTDQIEEVLRVVQQNNVQLVVVDSVEAATAASREYAGDANDATIRMHQALRLLGITSILIDHVSTGTIADSKAPRKAYGSIFKMNYARMAFELKSVVNGPGRITLGLYNVKRNNGGLPLKPRAISVEFVENESTCYGRGAMDDPDLMQGLDAMDRIASVLKGAGKKHYSDIAVETGLTESTVKTKLSRGKKDRGLFVDLGSGNWGLVNPNYQPYEAGDRIPF